MSVEPLRMDLSKIAPDAYRHFLQLEGLIGQHVERKLLHLLKLRASQINGCAYCIAMHTDEALRDGEPTERLTLLDAWEESSLYSDKERAALAWIEEVTLIADTGASRESFEALKAHFSEEEIAWLTLAGVQINAWNRMAISSRAQYDRAMFAHAAPAANRAASFLIRARSFTSAVSQPCFALQRVCVRQRLSSVSLSPEVPYAISSILGIRSWPS